MQQTSQEFDAWNPGIQSTLPSALVPYVTLHNPDHVFETLKELEELSEFTGITTEQLVTFRPSRLLVHELLVRVCADYSVSDGDEYEDLGNNFRRMASTILDNHLVQLQPQVEDVYQSLHQEVAAVVEQCLKDLPSAPDDTAEKPDSLFGRLFGRKEIPKKIASPMEQDQALVSHWQSRVEAASGIEMQAYQALLKIIGAIFTKHGRIIGDSGLHRKLVVSQLCNQLGSRRIGDWLAPKIAESASKEGFDLLPVQQAPVIINVKGASAAGKSTLRPLQEKLTTELGLQWRDFALISPDIFRKFLLDYTSLGEHFKYAGMCSGEELQIVDQKLDALMARKARQNSLPHLLIDRFRFDSFATKSNEEGSNLLTRFGSRVFMFYMITPPHSTVERAWKRGLQVGRFKAVDDLLDHNLEAFNGMPQLFFTWALNRDKDVYYEFLDNSVALGEKPRTVAYGENGSLVIQDLEKFTDINRYQKLEVNAVNAEEVYAKSQTDVQHLLSLTRDCIERLNAVTFCDFDSGRIYARVVQGQTAELDADLLKVTVQSTHLADGFVKMFDDVVIKHSPAVSAPYDIDREQVQTLGRND